MNDEKIIDRLLRILETHEILECSIENEILESKIGDLNNYKVFAESGKKTIRLEIRKNE
jgi:hypothetical protein